jgi:hypothetical protein
MARGWEYLGLSAGPGVWLWTARLVVLAGLAWSLHVLSRVAGWHSPRPLLIHGGLIGLAGILIFRLIGP